MNITEYRKAYPQFNDVGDVELAHTLHQQHNTDMPFEEFTKKFGLETPQIGALSKTQALKDIVRNYVHNLVFPEDMVKQEALPGGGAQPSDVRTLSPARTLTALGIYYGGSYWTGRALYTPNLITPNIAERLAESIGRFPLTTDEKTAGRFLSFVGGLKTAGNLVEPFMPLIPARETIRLAVGGGATFMLRNMSEQGVDWLRQGKDIDKKSLFIETGLGIIAGGIAERLYKISDIVKWMNFIAKNPAYKDVPVRLMAKVAEAIRAGIQGMPEKTINKVYGNDIRNLMSWVYDRTVATSTAAANVASTVGRPSTEQLALPGTKERWPLAPEKVTGPTVSKAVGRKPMVAQPTSLAVSEFKELAANYSSTRAQDLGVPVVPSDPILRAERLKVLRVMNSKRAKAPVESATNKLGIAVSTRHAFDHIEENYGVSLSGPWNSVLLKSGTAAKTAVDEIASFVKPSDIVGLTKEQNDQIGDYLFSPETRTNVESKMSLDTIAVAKKVEGILQGPGAREAQVAVFRLWDKTGRKPSNVRYYSNARAVAENWIDYSKPKAPPAEKQAEMPAKGESQVSKFTVEHLTKFIDTAMKKKPVDAGELRFNLLKIAANLKKKTARISLGRLARNEDFINEITVRYNHPDDILAELRTAKAEGRLVEELKSYPNLGLRDFYYMSDMTQQDLIDSYLGSSLRPLTGTPSTKAARPSTIPGEAYPRKGKPEKRPGSVIVNIMRYHQRLSVYNSIADDLDKFIERLNSVPSGLSSRDRRVTGQILDNLLMRRRPPDEPFATLLDMQRWFWRTRNSLLFRPGSSLSRSFRNFFQPEAMSAYAINQTQAATELTKFGAHFAKGGSFADYDPAMMEQFDKYFPTQVTQKEAIFKELLLRDAGSITANQSSRVAIRRLSSLLERTGALFGLSDEYTRIPVWCAQYQTTKNAALDYLKNGDINKFYAKTRLNSTSLPQQELVQDLLDGGKIDELAANSANWATEDILFRYKPAERSGLEQTAPQKVLAGPQLTFARGAAELMWFRGARPIIDGLNMRDFGRVKMGAENIVKGLAASFIVAAALGPIVGRRTYELLNMMVFEPLDPVTSQLVRAFKDSAQHIRNYEEGKISLPKAALNVFNTWEPFGESMLIPFADEILDVYESFADKRGASVWRVVLNQFTGDTLTRARRTKWQAIMHGLLGSYEIPPENKIGRPERPEIESRPVRERR